MEEKQQRALDALMKYMVGVRRSPRDLLSALVHSLIDANYAPLFSTDDICQAVASTASPPHSRQASPRGLSRQATMETLALRSSTPGLSSSRRPSLKPAATKELKELLSSGRPSLTRQGSAESVSAARTQLTRKDTVESVSAGAESAWNKVRVSMASVKAFEQINEERPGSAALVGEQGDRAIIKRTKEALKVLVLRSGLNFEDVLGQMLWRHRNSEPLQESHHKSCVENPRWVIAGQDVGEEFIEKCKTVFRILAKPEGGRMKLPQWKKVMEMIQSNPVLKTRVRRSDCDRLWHGETRSLAENSLGMKDFMGLLLKTAETIEVHPMMVFFTVSAYARSLGEDEK